MGSYKVNRLVKVFVLGVICFCVASTYASVKDERRTGLRGNAQRNLQNRRMPWLGDSIKFTADIPYAGTDNPRQKLDLMLPAKHDDKPLPVIVFIHGGGWQAGNKRAGLWRIAKFVASGKYAAVSVGYRLTGEAKWPAQIHDCKAAIRWVRANAKKHGFDADRIAVWGTSAGGHLVAMLGTSGGVDAVNGKLGSYPKVSSRVTCVVDFFGPTDLLNINKKPRKAPNPKSPVAKLLGGSVQDNPKKAAQASPITHVSKDDPPFLMVHGSGDPVVSIKQSQMLHGALKKVNVKSTLLTVDGGGHGRGFGPDVNKAVARFFAHHLRGKKTKWQDKTVKAIDKKR